jgi:hypothetical protein
MLAMERYNALANPTCHQVYLSRSSTGRRHSLKVYFNLHWHRLLKYIGPIILFATIFYIPKWLELEVDHHQVCSSSTNDVMINVTSDDTIDVTSDDDTSDVTSNDKCDSSYDILVTDLRSNNHYNLWYLNVFNLLLTAVIPVVMLTYLNLNIYFKFKEYVQRQPLANTSTALQDNSNHVQQIAKKREKDMIQQTRILFSIVILFILFHILRIILNIEEFATLEKRKMAKGMGCEWLQYWTIIAAPVSHILLQINSSINFVIYCFFNKSFRHELVTWWTSFLNVFKMRNNSRLQRTNMTFPDTKMCRLSPTHQPRQ